MEGLDIIKTEAIGSLDKIIYTGQIIVGVLLLALIAIILFRFLSYKNKFRIKEVVKGRYIIHDDKYKEWKDKDGIVWCRLLKRREITTLPPPEAIELDKKGNKVVEAYRLSSGEYIYAKDVSEPIPLSIQNITDTATRDQTVKTWLKEHGNVIAAYQPLTSNQRLIFLGQLEKAYARKTKQWQDYLLPMTSIAALLILVVCLMIFWGDIAKPIIEANQQQIALQTLQKEQLQLIKEIKYSIQQIGSGGSNTPLPEVPD